MLGVELEDDDDKDDSPTSGHDGDDSLSGGEGDDHIDGGDGENHLSGNDGDDDVRGGVDADDIAGGAGDDTVHGGDGTANMLFHLYSGTGTKLWETTLLNVPNGSSPSVTGWSTVAPSSPARR